VISQITLAIRWATAQTAPLASIDLECRFDSNTIFITFLARVRALNTLAVRPSPSGTHDSLHKPARPERRQDLLSWQRMGKVRFNAVYLKVPEGYVAFVEELPGTNTQGSTLDEARTNLEEAVNMVLEANRCLSEESLEGANVTRESLILSAA